MSRGTAKQVGDRFTNANGYTYEKTKEGWEPIQKLIAERKLGRSLKTQERAYFIDNDKSNHSPDNVGVKVVYDKKSPQGRLMIIQARITDLEDQLEDLRAQSEKLKKQIAS